MHKLGSLPVPAVYDATRAKFLSFAQIEVSFGSEGNVDGAYVRFNQMSSPVNGPRMPWNGTIIAVTANSGPGGNAAKSFEIRKNGAVTSLLSFTASVYTYTNTAANVDFNAGDGLQVYCTSAGQFVEDPTVTLIIAWRF